MQKSYVSLAIVALSACGSDHENTGGSGPQVLADSGASGSDAFDPPPPADGFTRIKAASIPEIGPGDDVTYCQYVMEPLDHDVDVLTVFGYQSKFGHHAAAFVYTPAEGEKPGANFPCMGTEITSGAAGLLKQGAFLGALGGTDGRQAGTPLPEGVGIRLAKGNGIMLNVHFINTGDQTVKGDAVVDIKYVDPDPGRKLAALFGNANTSFALPVGQETTSSIDCVTQSDVQIIMMTNHMHEFGTSAVTEVIRAGGGPTDVVHEDPTWSSDMQFNSVYSRYPIENPFLIHAGDTVRTRCNWSNTTSADIAFPREMCAGIGFALVTNDHPTAPICYDGNWIAGGL